jgi:hypothetical protein
MLAKDFVLGIYRQDLLPERRTALVIGALESLAKREKGVEAIVAMRQVLPLVFGLNVVAAQDASGIIESWPRIHAAGLSDSATSPSGVDSPSWARM